MPKDDIIQQIIDLGKPQHDWDMVKLRRIFGQFPIQSEAVMSEQFKGIHDLGSIIFASPSSIAHMIVQVCKEIKGSDDVRNDVSLMIGTCAKESNFVFREQLDGGPARGIFQVEPETAVDIFRHYLRFNERRYNQLTKIWFNLQTPIPYFEPGEDDLARHLATNDVFCTVIARYKYLRDKDPIPSEPVDQAKYWHKVYQTYGGAHTWREYLKRWMDVGQEVFAQIDAHYFADVGSPTRKDKGKKD